MQVEGDFANPIVPRMRGQRLVAALREIHKKFGQATGLPPQRKRHEVRWVEFDARRTRVYAQGPGYKDEPAIDPRTGKPRLGWHPTDTRAIVVQGRGSSMRICTDFGFLDVFEALAAAAEQGRLTPPRITATAELLAGLAFSMWYEWEPHAALQVDAVRSGGRSMGYDYGDGLPFTLTLTEMWRFRPPARLVSAFSDAVLTVPVRDRDDPRISFDISPEAALHALQVIAINEDNLYERLSKPGMTSKTARMGRINQALTTARVLAEVVEVALEFPPPGWLPMAEFNHIRRGFPRDVWAYAAKVRPPNPGLTVEEWRALLSKGIRTS